MAVTEMYDITKEYYRVPVTLRVGGAAIDPTGFVVEFAVMDSGDKPTGGDWKAGDWETDSGKYLARILIGDAAGFLIVSPNVYDVYMRLTDATETPVRMVGQIKAK